MSQAYTVKYREYWCGEERQISLLAKNKVDAYDRAVYEEIPKIEGCAPYSAWVHSVTYSNGKYHCFNTSEGNCY